MVEGKISCALGGVPLSGGKAGISRVFGFDRVFKLADAVSALGEGQSEITHR
jgi:hypothetical protein